MRSLFIVQWCDIAWIIYFESNKINVFELNQKWILAEKNTMNERVTSVILLHQTKMCSIFWSKYLEQIYRMANVTTHTDNKIHYTYKRREKKRVDVIVFRKGKWKEWLYVSCQLLQFPHESDYPWFRVFTLYSTANREFLFFGF